MFALVMTLPLDFEDDRRRSAALVGMMLGLGYTIAAISPFVLGAVRDVTGSFDAVLWTARHSSARSSARCWRCRGRDSPSAGAGAAVTVGGASRSASRRTRP